LPLTKGIKFCPNCGTAVTTEAANTRTGFGRETAIPKNEVDASSNEQTNSQGDSGARREVDRSMPAPASTDNSRSYHPEANRLGKGLLVIALITVAVFLFFHLIFAPHHDITDDDSSEQAASTATVPVESAVEQAKATEESAENQAMTAFMEKSTEELNDPNARPTFYDDGSEYPYPKGSDGCPLSTYHFPGITLDMPPAERVRRCRTNANRMLCYDGAAAVEKVKKLCYVWGELSQ
jgi:hypothetical protein